MFRDSVEGTSTSSYYTILGVPIDSSARDIRHAYCKLAMQWQPDKWAKSPSRLGEAKLKFQQILEAYSDWLFWINYVIFAVLSDQRKRTMYDAGFYDHDDEEDEGFADFLQEMTSLMHKTRREDKHYSMNELQSMFWDMAQSFEFPEWSSSSQQLENWFSSPQQPVYESAQWFSRQFPLDDSRSSKRARSETKPVS